MFYRKKKKLLLLNSLELMSLKERKEILEEMEELFSKVLGEDMGSLDSYIVFYWISILNVVIRKLRRDNIMFIIKKYRMFFVLQTQKEANYYKGVLNNDITNLEKAKIRADTWVSQEKWRDI